MTILGGHAIMLRCDGMDATHRLGLMTLAAMATAEWNGKMPTDDFHMTLQFVGRDLTKNDALAMFAAAIQLSPVTLKFSGVFDVFQTSKGRYLVMKVVPTEELHTMRTATRSFLRDAGLNIRDDFAWNPHITLAETSDVKTSFVLPQAINPFEFVCSEVEVKYGKRKMVIDL